MSELCAVGTKESTLSCVTCSSHAALCAAHVLGELPELHISHTLVASGWASTAMQKTVPPRVVLRVLLVHEGTAQSSVETVELEVSLGKQRFTTSCVRKEYLGEGLRDGQV